MTSKPKKQINFITILLIFIFMIIVGNLGTKLINNKINPIKSKRIQR